MAFQTARTAFSGYPEGSPQKSALRRSCGQVFSEIRPKATSGWPDDCFRTDTTMSASGP